MAFLAVCPGCQTRYRTAGMPQDRRLRCKRCGMVFTAAAAIDAGSEPASDQSDPTFDTNAIPAVMGDRSALARAGVMSEIELISFPEDQEDTSAVPIPRAAGGSIAGALANHEEEEKYVVEEEIARGGMGMILRAVDRDVRREVAMKVMLAKPDDEHTARFLEEAQVTGQLEHPHIMPVHDLGVDADGRLFFTMKLVKGQSLEQILHELDADSRLARRRYGLNRLLQIFVSVCQAIGFAHSRGVVHRDLKPANIMVGDFGEVLVMDWGLAKIGAVKQTGKSASDRRRSEITVDRAQAAVDAELAHRVTSLRQDTDSGLTMNGRILGTPLYMPPEQARGRIDEINERSDIYSLGAILYEILTFEPPVTGKTIKRILQNVVLGRIEPPETRAPNRDIPPELSAIAMKALACRPRDRYPSVQSLREDIELYLEGRAVSAKDDTLWETLVKMVRRNRVASLAVGVAALVLVLVVCAAMYANVQARTRAEDAQLRAQMALQEVREEQARRRAEQQQSAPIFLTQARKSVLGKDLANALLNLNVALEYDAALADAWLLRAQIRAHQGHFSAAAADLERYLRLCPDDNDAKELLALVWRGDKHGADTVAGRIAEVFQRQEVFGLVREKGLELAQHLKLAQGRVEEAWPGAGSLVRLHRGRGLYVRLDGERYADLSPLKGLPFVSLYLHSPSIKYLSPLRGMALEQLTLYDVRIKTLAPLKGMPLKHIELRLCPALGDISALKGMPLETLYIYRCFKIKRLDPIMGAPLKSLDLYYPGNYDLYPLKGMKLDRLIYYAGHDVNLSILKGLPLKTLSLHASKIIDFRPIAKLPLESLDLGATRVRDLALVRGMPLKHLDISSTSVKDLSPLRGAKLESISMYRSRVTDLTPLAGMPLQRIVFTPQRVYESLSVLRKMKTLKRIAVSPGDFMPADVFWKKIDAGAYAPPPPATPSG